MKKNNIGFLQGTDGTKSSKRLCGVVILAVGLVMAVYLFFAGLKNPGEVYESSFTVVKDLLIAGTSLLGMGLAEGLNGLFSRNKRK